MSTFPKVRLIKNRASGKVIALECSSIIELISDSDSEPIEVRVVPDPQVKISYISARKTRGSSASEPTRGSE